MDEKEINVANKEVSTADPVTTASEVVTTASPTETTAANDLTLAQTLIETRSAKSKVKGVVIGEQSESTTRTRPQQLPSKDKDFKAQLQDELEEEDRLVRQREEEANIVSLDNVQAMIDADYQMDQTKMQENKNKEKESSKKQKLEEDKESEELKQCLEIVSDDGDDVTIDATPLSTKSPTIVDYKIHKEGKKSFSILYRECIVKARFKKTEPVNYMDNFLLLNLKIVFEHHVEDNVWKNQQGLVKMFNDVKLQVDYEVGNGIELLRLVIDRNSMIKRLHDDLEVTTAKVCVTAARLNTVSHFFSFDIAAYELRGRYFPNILRPEEAVIEGTFSDSS
ncbi:hypothetical protein Tco_0373191 [Tanacetum coccineum]